MLTAILALLFALVPALLIMFAVIWRAEDIRFAAAIIGFAVSVFAAVLVLAVGAVHLARAITGQ